MFAYLLFFSILYPNTLLLITRFMNDKKTQEKEVSLNGKMRNVASKQIQGGKGLKKHEIAFLQGP